MTIDVPLRMRHNYSIFNSICWHRIRAAKLVPFRKAERFLEKVVSAGLIAVLCPRWINYLLNVCECATESYNIGDTDLYTNCWQKFAEPRQILRWDFWPLSISGYASAHYIWLPSLSFTPSSIIHSNGTFSGKNLSDRDHRQHGSAPKANGNYELNAAQHHHENGE